MTISSKIRRPRIRPISATPKELKAWESFQSFVELVNWEEEVPPLVQSELERLCANGNPLAMRFRNQLTAALHPVRSPDEPGKAPPGRIERTSGLKWGTPPKGE